MLRAYKFRLYPSKKQEQEMQTHLWLAKNLWNHLLDHSKQLYKDFGRFPTESTLQFMVKDSGLFSQTQQEIAHRLHRAITRFCVLRKKGIVAGFPRFKNVDRMKSLYYPQFGFELENKLKVNPFGDLAIKKHREIKGKIKTLTLKREASGKWFAIFCAEQKPAQPKTNNGGAVGVDLGLMTFATLSNGEKVRNPRHLRKREEKLASHQRKLSKKKKGGRNRLKAKRKVALVHEKIANARLDFLHKTANYLLANYSFIALEELASQEMAAQGHGKGINDAGWGSFADILRYKAESAGCEVVFVDPRNTSKECSCCGSLVQKTLRERQHVCPSCGLSLDRDVNAAVNILAKATVGITGSNACRNEPRPSLKQEAQGLSLGYNPYLISAEREVSR